MKSKGANRRYSYRSVISALLVVGIFLPFVFIRTAFLALDASATICPKISCLGWRIRPLLFRGSDSSLLCAFVLKGPFSVVRFHCPTVIYGGLHLWELGVILLLSLELTKEIKRVYLDVEERGETLDPKFIESAPNSFDDLLEEIASDSKFYQHVDLKSFLLKTKAMLLKMELKVKSSRRRASIYQHLASVGIPISMHCVTLKLAEEYLINSACRTSLPSPEYAYRLTSESYHHFAIMTDNILAASVAVTSAVRNSLNPEKLVFHIVTDKKTYNAMHAWFALNSIFPAIIEVKGLHQYEWAPHVSATVLKTIKEVRKSTIDHKRYTAGDDNYDDRRLEALSPSSFSVFNYLRIHLPEFFPKLKRLILLDDDVVVQHDLSPLFDTDLNGNIIGAVSLSDNISNYCMGKKYGDYFNYSNPSISLLPIEFEQNECVWLSGMNIFNLDVWRRTNMTMAYQEMLKLNRESGFSLSSLGWLSPALIAFKNKTHEIESSWLLSELGLRLPPNELISSASVLHFSGSRKPWLEIGFPGLRKIWFNYLNHSNSFLVSCRVVQ